MAKVDFKVSQKLLEEVLGNHGVLLFQTLNYHWNLVGREFHDYHLLFDGQYKKLFEDMDLIAERIRAVEGKALGSMKAFVSAATIKEDTAAVPEPHKMVVNLLKQHELLIAHINDSLETLEKKTKDFGSRKMLEDILVDRQKTAWMLRSLTGK
jgi:starvation-inducible DNA-binding protein